MKPRICFIVLALVLILTPVPLPGQAPMWNVDLGEEVKLYHFLKDGAYLFFAAGEFAWLYDATSGSRVYALEVKDYEVKGAQQIVGDNYLVSTDEKLQCYNALTGKLVWEQAYTDIDQESFSALTHIGGTTVLQYGSVHIAVDLTSGKELWRTSIAYNQKVSNKGGYNYWALDKQNKLLVLLEDDAVGLYDYKNGKQLFSGEHYAIETDFFEEQGQWYYISPDQRYVLFALDDAVAILDVKENKELHRCKTSFDVEKPSIIPTEQGCVVLGEENVVFLNAANGAVVDVKASVSDFRTFEILKVNNREILFAGLKNEMFAVDLTGGKILWRSKKDDPMFEGYAHRYITVDGNALLITYTLTGGNGVEVWLMSLDAMTGTVNYKTPPLSNSPYGQADWARSMFGGLAKFMGQRALSRSLGWENIGYNYSIVEFEGSLVFGTLSINPMKDPATKESTGDGIAIINPKTGEILFKEYLRLSDYSLMSIGAIRYADMMPHLEGGVAYLVGNENIAAYDLKAKKRLWLNKETIKGIPREAMVVDGVLYVKFGEHTFKVAVTEPAIPPFDSPSMTIEDKWDKDPYGFAAYDAATGALLWRIETEVDPSFLTPNFSLKNNFDPVTKRLYYGDEENIYALQMRRDGGKFDYVINLDKNKLGEMPFKKTYAITEWPIGSVSLSISGDYLVSTHSVGGKDYGKFISAAEEADATTSYDCWFTIWGVAAKKCLRVVYDRNSIFAMAKEGIALFNAADGKPSWIHAWEYNQDNVQYSPIIAGDKLVYCVDRKLTSVDMKSGKTLWQADEAKRPIFLLSPNEKFIFTIDKELIRGYQL